MKGVNASRIAALAAGAILLGSSAIAAGVMYENVELVNPNGQPTAKIVVGSNAAVSDGIAAANIASVLANYAYKSSTLSAELSGDATCSTTGEVSGAGTCAVSDKKATIEITLPGVLANAYQFKTLIHDAIDKTLGNRITSLSEDKYDNTITLSDTSQILSPLRGSTASNTQYLYRIGETQYQGFALKSISDPQASSEFAYTEEQGFWVGSSSDPGSAVYYDSGTSYRNIVAKPNIIAYNVRFIGNDYGVPVCTGNIATSGNWTSCTATSDRTDNHRMHIWFLGEEWVISSMTEPSTEDLNNTVGAKAGGKIKLAKEAKYDIINVGGVIDGGDFKIRLADISVATGASNEHPAIIDVLDANDAVIGQIQVSPATTYTFTQSSTGKSIKVHVYRTAPGFTLSAKWAEIAVYTDEITLEDGKRYNNAASDDTNWKYIKTSLLWKNRDGSSTDGRADSLREIVLYVDDMSSYMSGSDNRMVSGDSIPFPKANTIYTLTYNGLDLESADYATTSLSVDSRSLNIGNVLNCNTKNASYETNFIKVRSDTSNAFGGTTDVLGNDRVEEFFIDPAGNFTMNGTDQSPSVATINAANWSSQVFWMPSGCDYYKMNKVFGPAEAELGNLSNINTTILTTFANTTAAVKFDSAGADSGAYGAIRWYFVSNNVSNTTMTTTPTYGSTQLSGSVVGEIVLQEDAGKRNATSHYPVLTRFPVYKDASSTSFWRFKTQDSTTAVAYYSGINDSDIVTPTAVKFASSYELPLYTDRGTKVTGVSLSGVDLQVAKKVGQPTFTFTFADEELASSGQIWEAEEGDEKTISGGIKLKLKSITETVGSCVASTASGAMPACTVNLDGVSARVMPNNVASVEVVEPYDIRQASSMVITDSEAGSAGGVVITVGGPVVNSVTASVLQDAAVDFDTNSVYVKAFGSKIVVAGRDASDTMVAAQQFIDALQKN
ncbi:hypothetical protein COU37_00025 [Candidatus Micrarchaeota archaeon CG10_big_fil_rev_8_21_14_0_10_45_29]|nr:MAG: hypothetical protein COU37_00025 [Candidatus Micrarchaeota archaeon CG10_big_fil_rev_8_21_14_0_10_45_29]